MDNPKIDSVYMENLELIDSRTINLFSDKLVIKVENITFHFKFIPGFNRETAANINKTDDSTYDISIYNFKTGKLRGMVNPLKFGVINNVEYYFSLVGIANEGNLFANVTFNLLKETK